MLQQFSSAVESYRRRHCCRRRRRQERRRRHHRCCCCYLNVSQLSRKRVSCVLLPFYQIWDDEQHNRYQFKWIALAAYLAIIPSKSDKLDQYGIVLVNIFEFCYCTFPPFMNLILSLYTEVISTAKTDKERYFPTKSNAIFFFAFSRSFAGNMSEMNQIHLKIQKNHIFQFEFFTARNFVESTNKHTYIHTYIWLISTEYIYKKKFWAKKEIDYFYLWRFLLGHKHSPYQWVQIFIFCTFWQMCVNVFSPFVSDWAIQSIEKVSVFFIENLITLTCERIFFLLTFISCVWKSSVKE